MEKGVIIRKRVTGKGASTVNLQYLAFTLILLILLIYIRHTGKKRDICLHPTLFLSRMRAVTWTTKLKKHEICV